MTSSWLIVLLLGAAWTVQGNLIETMEQVKDALNQAEDFQRDMYDGLYDESIVGTEYDSNDNLRSLTYDDEYEYDSGEEQHEYEEPGMNYGTYDDDAMYYDSYYDYLEDDNDVFMNEKEISELTTDIEDTLEQSLVGKCSGGKCNYCLKVWKISLCAEARIVGNRLIFSIKFNRKVLLTRKVSSKGSYTITIPKKTFGGLRIFMKSNLFIKLTDINIKRKTFCVQAEVKTRFPNRLRKFPKKPRCFNL